MSCGAVSPGVFVERGTGFWQLQLQGKNRWMSERLDSELWKPISELSLTLGDVCTWPDLWVLDGRIIKRFMPSAAALRHLPTVLDMRSKLSWGLRVAEYFSCDPRDGFSTPRLMQPPAVNLEWGQCTLNTPSLTFISVSMDHIQFWRAPTGGFLWVWGCLQIGSAQSANSKIWCRVRRRRGYPTSHPSGHRRNQYLAAPRC